MLFTDIMEPQSDLVYPDGYKHDRALDSFRNRLAKASYFVLDEQAVAMAANVSQSKPSSIVSCLPFVKLPAPLFWLEFSNQHLKQAMTDLGSPNIRTERHEVDVERSGFLLWEEDGFLMMDYVHKDKLSSRSYCDLAPVRGAFDVSSDNHFASLLATMFQDTDVRDNDLYGAKGKVAKRVKEMRDPEQYAASRDLDMRFSAIPHPDLDRLRQAVRSLMPQSSVTEIEQNQAADMRWMFLMFVLPALILLNCRNAVDREVVEAPAKLNKHRAKKGKPLIQGYQFIKMHLSASAKRVYRRLGISSQSRSGGLVIGHFKVRKTGIWWWSPHWRGAPPETERAKVYVMTR